MNRNAFYVLPILAAGAVIATASLMPKSEPEDFMAQRKSSRLYRHAVAESTPNDTLLEDIKTFKNWRKANPKPYMLSYDMRIWCIQIPGAIERQEIDPHREKYIDVYVNPVGEKQMFNGEKFPEGTILVKDRKDAEHGNTEFYTIMLKREKGYNTDCGDWEFAVADAKMSAFSERGKLERCMTCHRDPADKDYAFRTYLDKNRNTHSPGWLPYLKD